MLHPLQTDVLGDDHIVISYSSLVPRPVSAIDSRRPQLKGGGMNDTILYVVDEMIPNYHLQHGDGMSLELHYTKYS